MILAITMNPAIDKVYSVEDFNVGGVFRPDSMTATAGGKGLNVARVLKLLGEQVMAAGFIAGNTGAFIEEEVKKQGINSQFISIDGETRICIAVMDRKNNTSTEILEPGPAAASEDCKKFLGKYRTLIDSCDVITVSGSLPLGVPEGFYYAIIKEAKHKGKRSILDTSGKYFTEGIKALPYMIKPNTAELEKVMGRELPSIKDKARALLKFKDDGIELPCMTMGRDGALAVLDDSVYHFYAPPIDVVNTVGSGDSFVAGCAAGFSRGLDAMESIKLGMACGMANTQFFKTGMISIELVDKFLNMITARPVI